MTVYVVEISGADVTPRVFMRLPDAWDVVLPEIESGDDDGQSIEDLLYQLGTQGVAGGKDWTISRCEVE